MTDHVFLLLLRQALQHLYDAPELRKSPLLALFGLDEREGMPLLRHALEQGIDALKPATATATQSDAWRNHQYLVRRYVQQYSQEEVAASFGISVRHAQRQAKSALAALADNLRTRYSLTLDHPAGEAAQGAGEDAGDDSQPPSREQELSWLERSAGSEPAAVAAVVEGVLKTLAPLQAAAGAQITYTLSDESAGLAVEWTVLRQALLNLSAAALRTGQGGKISIEVKACGGQVCVSMRWAPKAEVMGNEETIEELDIVRQLLALAGGTLEVVQGRAGDALEVSLSLPALPQSPVLVVDDNPDTLQLFRRYLEGTRYRFIGAQDPEQALALAQEAHPRVIVLDVMLPAVDGWEVLGRLREHPATRGIPVIVCSVLPREDLALSLGAAAFVSKPVKRQALLDVLEEQAPG